jgi:hypothetical protein
VCCDGCLDGCKCVGMDVWMVVSVFSWCLCVGIYVWMVLSVLGWLLVCWDGCLDGF